MMLRELAFPERINVEPTNRCNMRCRLCPHPVLTRPRGDMDLGLFRRIAAECARHGTTLWLQYMGEPLLHPRILEMISAAKEAGVNKVGLSTNGSLLDEAMGRKIVNSGLDRLECSLDATDEKGFLANRGSPHFRRVLGNIEGFLRLKKEQGGSGPVTSIQYMESLIARKEQGPEILSQWKGRLGRNDFVMSIRDYSFAGSVRDPCPDGGRTPCRWPFRSSVILWDGTMLMCGSDFDGRAPMGNVGEKPIEEVWKGEAFEAVRRLHRTGTWSGHFLCGGCDDWRISDGSGYNNILLAGELL